MTAQRGDLQQREWDAADAIAAVTSVAAAEDRLLAVEEGLRGAVARVRSLKREHGRVLQEFRFAARVALQSRNGVKNGKGKA